MRMLVTGMVMIGLVAGLAAAVAAAEAEAAGSLDKGRCTLLLSGGGLSIDDGNKIAVDAEAAHFFADNMSVGLRQSLDYEDFRPGIELIGYTSVAADWYWAMESLIPFAGVGVGVAYSNMRSTKPFVAPEIGVRKFLNGAAFLNASAQYAMYYNVATLPPNTKWNGRFEYSLGIGVLY